MVPLNLAEQNSAAGLCYSDLRLHLRSSSLASLAVRLLQTWNEQSLAQRPDEMGLLSLEMFILDLNKDM